jgi:hypothetical protein
MARIMVKDAEELPKTLASTLGLVDLALGSVGLYAMRITYATSVTQHFPSTNNQTLDIVLIACAAAALGKLITLLVATGMRRLHRDVRTVRDLLTSISEIEAEIEKENRRSGTSS